MSGPHHKPVAAECLVCDRPLLVTECEACAFQFAQHSHRHLCNLCAIFFLGERARDRKYKVREYA